MTTQDQRRRVAVAGASGFIGSALCRALSSDYRITALTRSPTLAQNPIPDLPVDWRLCDLWSRKEMAAGLADAQYAVYLVNPMIPTSRLTQADSADLNLLVADNFARAAYQHGIRQILYLGNLWPDGPSLPRVLAGPGEVERTLAGHGVPVTSVRAGLVVGPGGRYVNLLTVLACRQWLAVPDWANAHQQPVALDDVIQALCRCLGNPSTFGHRYQIGGRQVFTVRELLNITARVLGHHPPSHRWSPPPWLYRRLVCRLSGAYPSLVERFVAGLQVNQLATDNVLPDWLGRNPLSFEQALRESLHPRNHTPLPSPRADIRAPDDAEFRRASRVRSIQRIRLPPGRNALWLADNYFHWLPGTVAFFLICQQDADRSWRIGLRWPPLTLLHLWYRDTHSSPDRQMFFIDGGVLARVGEGRQGRFEFRDVLGGRFTIAAIHDFSPHLPWRFYALTQAVVHVWVMRAYQRRLARLADAGQLEGPSAD